MEADRERAKRHPLVLAQAIEKRSPKVHREGRNPSSFYLASLCFVMPWQSCGEGNSHRSSWQWETAGAKAVSEGGVLPIL